MWQQLHKSVWKDLGHTFDQVFSSLQRHTGFIEKHAGASQSTTASSASSTTMLSIGSQCEPNAPATDQSWARYRIGVKEDWARFETAEGARKAKQRSKVRSRIPSTSKMSDMHSDFRRRNCENTGRWLFRSHAEVGDWMSEDEISNSALWLHGGKGFGMFLRMIAFP